MKQQHFSTEEVIKVLTRVQRMHLKNGMFLVTEDWDWLVVMQCLQDHGLFKSNPKRMPLKAFVEWMEQQHVPQLFTTCSANEMSLACRELDGARYPWTDESWEPYVLIRWRLLYRHLDKMLTEEMM